MIKILLSCAVLCCVATYVFAEDIDCGAIQKNIGIKESKDIADALNKMNSNNNIKVDKIRVLAKKGNWYMADCTFNKVDAGIFVLHKHLKKIEVIEELSGNIRDGNQGELEEIITDYFMKYAPGVPRDLIYCTSKKITKYWE